MLRAVIQGQLVRGSRPGYGGERGKLVTKAEVDAWIADAKATGIQSIICLLADDQLPLYPSLQSGLIAYYRQAGFEVAHIPAIDHQSPPLSHEQLSTIWRAYQALPKPVLIHCSAGVDRTGAAVEEIVRRTTESLQQDR